MSGVDLSRKLEKEVIVAAPRERVWNAWTTDAGVRSFFAVEGHVSAIPGEPYEILFKPGDPTMGTAGLRALASRPPHMLAFEWNAPPEWPAVRRVPTWVVIELEEAGRGATLVRLTHLGWRAGEDWDEVYDYFHRAWDIVLSRLQQSLEKAPIEASALQRPPPEWSADAPDRSKWRPYASLRRPARADFPRDMTAAEEATMTRHVAYMETLRASGRLALAGPCRNAAFGMSLFLAADDADAQRILSEDPAIADGVMSAEVHAYKASFGSLAALEYALSVE